MSAKWWPADDAVRERVPPALWSWLTETGSLTERLKACCDDFTLVVLDERDIVVDADEAGAMALPGRTPARVRKVHLCCGGVPCIQARSLLPHVTLAGAGRALADLGARPLGDALFAHADMVRSPIEITDSPTWGRRSVFRLAGQPVLGSGVLLPGRPPCTG
jgi:chorismate lyase